MKRAFMPCATVLLVVLLLMALGVAPLTADEARLRDQVRSRQNVIDAQLRSLQQQQRNVEFGSGLYWEHRRAIRALQNERSALRNLESALRRGDERRIEQNLAAFRRANEQSLRQQRSLVDTRARELQFGSREWHDHRRTSTTLRQQRRSSEPFGREYVRSLDAQIRMLESRRRNVEFGSREWHAINRQLNALRRARRSAR